MYKYIIEFLGTLFLTFIVMYTNNWLAIGSALAVVFLLGGPISGGYFNPAITMAGVAAGKLNTGDIVPYIISQMAGALVAFELIKVMKIIS